MSANRQFGFGLLCALPLVAVGLAGARPLHDVTGHQVIGWVVCAAALACMWWLGGSVIARTGAPSRTLALAGALLLAPWLLIALLWVGVGAPFQASALENQQRYLLLVVNALLVGAGFIVLANALRDRGEGFYSSSLLAAAIFASGLYVLCVSITLAHATMVVQGDRTPIPPALSHLYDVLEFFACTLTYLCTALAAMAMGKAGILGRTAVRVFVALCVLILVLLVLRGVEYPEISGQTAPWFTQPGVIVRIPAIPWILPGVLAAWLLRFAGAPARE